MARDRIHQFVDRCQTVILQHENAPTLLEHLEGCFRELTLAIRDVDLAEQQLARSIAARILLDTFERQHLPSDSDLFFLAAKLAAFDFLKPDYSALFGRWRQCADAVADDVTPQDQRVRRALTFIRRTFRSRHLSLERTAQVAGISAWHLAKLLQRETGAPFTQHLRSARINAATQLLRSRPLPLKQVADLVGYANDAQLRRDFKRITGVTPKRYCRAMTDRK